jgi:hypothetical protein
MKYQKPYDQADINASYVNANPASGIQGSIPPAEALEQPQREIVAAIVASGQTPTNSDMTQLVKAIQRGTFNFAQDTGTANAVVATFTPTPSDGAYGFTYGERIWIQKGAAANTGPVTLNTSGFTWPDGSALVAGDLPANAIFGVAFNGSGFHLLTVVGPSVFARASAGRNIVTFTASTTWTVPAGVHLINHSIWGGGGGGGGGGPGAGTNATGGGGGGFSQGPLAVTPGDVLTITVGAGGAAGGTPAATGGTGGASSVTVPGGATVTANGGTGGYGANGFYQTTAGNGGTASGGSVNLTGSPGSSGLGLGSYQVGGPGGGSPFGGYVSNLSASAAGSSGYFPGGGGGGSTANAAGGPGAGGYVEIFY